MKFNSNTKFSAIKHLLYILFLFYPFITKAQIIKNNMYGTVVDFDTQIPIDMVELTITNKVDTFHCLTDQKGFFYFKQIPVGIYLVCTTHLSYNKQIKYISINSGHGSAMTFELQKSMKEVSEIKIDGNNTFTPSNELILVSSKHINIDESTRYPGSIGDIQRIALNYSGTTNNNDESNNIIIRGNSPKNIQWKIDDIEIPNPNHFSEKGGVGGIIGILNSNVLSKADFTTSAYPADYGNVLAGVFDLTLRKGSKTNYESTFQIGLLGINACFEGPISKKKIHLSLSTIVMPTINYYMTVK